MRTSSPAPHNRVCGNTWRPAASKLQTLFHRHRLQDHHHPAGRPACEAAALVSRARGLCAVLALGLPPAGLKLPRGGGDPVVWAPKLEPWSRGQEPGLRPWSQSRACGLLVPQPPEPQEGPLPESQPRPRLGGAGQACLPVAQGCGFSLVPRCLAALALSLGPHPCPCPSSSRVGV